MWCTFFVKIAKSHGFVTHGGGVWMRPILPTFLSFEGQKSRVFDMALPRSSRPVCPQPTRFGEGLGLKAKQRLAVSSITPNLSRPSRQFRISWGEGFCIRLAKEIQKAQGKISRVLHSRVRIIALISTEVHLTVSKSSRVRGRCLLSSWMDLRRMGGILYLLLRRRIPAMASNGIDGSAFELEKWLK